MNLWSIRAGITRSVQAVSRLLNTAAPGSTQPSGGGSSTGTSVGPKAPTKHKKPKAARVTFHGPGVSIKPIKSDRED